MQADTARFGNSPLLLRWIKVGVTLLSVTVGFAGLAYALVPALDRTGSATASISPREIALLPLDEKSRLATRITIDRAQKSLCVSREIVFGHEPAMVNSGESLLIPDEAGLHQIAVFDQTLQIDDMEVRVVLHRFGPTERFHDRPNSSTELILWVNGQARVAGFLEGSAYGDDGTPVWERLAIYRRGGVLVATAAIGVYPLVRRGVVNGNLSTDNPWILYASEAFPSAAEIDRALEEDDSDASPASLPATSTIACRKPLPS